MATPANVIGGIPLIAVGVYYLIKGAMDFLNGIDKKVSLIV